MSISLIDLVERDILLSVKNATIRTLLPLVLYAALYPWLLGAMGPEVLGLWSLFASAPALAGLLDFGIPQLLSRSGSASDDSSLASVGWDGVRVTEWLYVFVSFSVSTIVNAVIIFGFPDIKVGSYSFGALILNVWLVGMGVAALLSARLHGAMLAAKHENHTVHLGFALQPSLTAGCTAVGLLVRHPIEGFSLGMLVSSMHLRTWFLRRWSDDRTQSHIEFRRGAVMLRDLLRQARGLYWAGATLAVRDPILRAVITVVGGLPAVAAYEIASRVTRVSRDLASAPFASLLTGFSALWGRNELSHILRLSLVSLATMVAIGGGLLTLATGGIIVAGSNWLGSPPPELIPATVLLSIWSMVTLFNVPYWHLLLATKQEGVALRAVMCHTLALVAAAPFLVWSNSSMTTVLALWLAASIATQHLIFRAASRTLAVSYVSLFSFSLVWPTLILAMFATSVAVLVGFLPERPVGGSCLIVILGGLYFYAQHLTLKRIGLHPAALASGRKGPKHVHATQRNR